MTDDQALMHETAVAVVAKLSSDDDGLEVPWGFALGALYRLAIDIGVPPQQLAEDLFKGLPTAQQWDEFFRSGIVAEAANVLYREAGMEELA